MDSQNQYFIIGGNQWAVDPNLDTALERFSKEDYITVYEVDTTELEFDVEDAPIWMDSDGFRSHWKWKESKENRIGATPLNEIYVGVRKGFKKRE